MPLSGLELLNNSEDQMETKRSEVPQSGKGIRLKKEGKREKAEVNS